jgi:hypothetical protein
MFVRCIVLAAALAASVQVVHADDNDIEPAIVDLAWEPTPLRWDTRSGPRYLVAALEVASLDLAINMAGRLRGEEAMAISPKSMWRNLTGGWEWDDDYFNTNQFRHPYMGALFFTSARSNNVGFWASTLYAFAGSLAWELFLENETPSYNDQISTSLGGIILGETMHRFYNVALGDAGSDAAWWRKGIAGVVSPMDAFTDYIIGGNGEPADPPPYFAMVSIGRNWFSEFEDDSASPATQTFGQLHGAVSASYGLPGDPDYEPTRPLDHLDLVAEVDVGDGKAFASLFTRGLLLGDGYDGARLHGFWGLYASYDYFNPVRLRVSAVGIGLGSSLQLRVGRKGFLQGTATSSFVPFGAAGAREENPDSSKDYHWGAGGAQLLELRLGRAHLGMLRFTSRSFEIKGAQFNEGHELVTHATFGAVAQVLGRHAIGVELIAMARKATYDDETLTHTDSGGQLRVFYTYLSDATFGAVLPD